MKNKFIKLFSVVKYDKILTPLLLIIIPVSILRGFFEYKITGISMYLLRDVLNISLILVCLSLYLLGYLRKSYLFIICMYGVLCTIIYTFIIGLGDDTFPFEKFFLEAEMIIILVIFAIGLLIHVKHMISILIFNFIFLIFCAYTTGSGYPIQRFIYYGVLVSAAGLMAYSSQMAFLQLNKKIRSINALILTKNVELKSSNRSKDQLFKVIGHDLRTPFFQLKSLVEMMDDAKDEQEIEQIKLLIKESANEGNRLLEDLLGWGSKYSNKEDLEISEQCVFPIIDRVFDYSNLKASMKGVNLVNSIDKSLELNMNATMMETVMRNLIANAIKFSFRGSDVIVKSEEYEDYLILEVMDSGMGMTEEQVHQLLVSSENVSTLGTENEGGSGHGVHIAKKMVEKQHGFLTIASIPKQGTIVSLRFSKN